MSHRHRRLHKIINEPATNQRFTSGIMRYIGHIHQLATMVEDMKEGGVCVSSQISRRGRLKGRRSYAIHKERCRGDLATKPSS